MESSQGPDGEIVLRTEHGTYELHGLDLLDANGVKVAQIPPEIATLIRQAVQLQVTARDVNGKPPSGDAFSHAREILDSMSETDRASSERRLEVLRAELRKRFEAARNDRTHPSE